MTKITVAELYDRERHRSSDRRIGFNEDHGLFWESPDGREMVTIIGMSHDDAISMPENVRYKINRYWVNADREIEVGDERQL